MTKRRATRRSHEAEAIARCESDIAGHVMKERVARSFDFRTPDKGSFYAYALTWTPGTVNLAGDLGELTVTHYQALWHFEAGMAWLASSDWDYLLGKTDRRAREVDAPATADYLIERAREDDRGDPDGAWTSLAARYGRDGYRGAVLYQFWRAAIIDDVGFGSPEAVGAICQDLLPNGDFYGFLRHPASDLYQINALQHGARMILASLPAAAEAPAA